MQYACAELHVRKHTFTHVHMRTCIHTHKHAHSTKRLASAPDTHIHRHDVIQTMCIRKTHRWVCAGPSGRHMPRRPGSGARSLSEQPHRSLLQRSSHSEASLWLFFFFRKGKLAEFSGGKFARVCLSENRAENCTDREESACGALLRALNAPGGADEAGFARGCPAFLCTAP